MGRISRYAVSHLWVPLAMIAGGITLFLVGVGSQRDTGKPVPKVVTTGGTELPGWGVVVLLVGILLVVLSLLLLDEVWRRSRFAKPETRRSKIDRLSASLKDALTVIDDIRREVDDGNRLVTQLEEETKTKRQLAQLSSADAEAVLLQLRETVRAETSRGVWVQFGINALFFLLGVGVTLLVAIRV